MTRGHHALGALSLNRGDCAAAEQAGRTLSHLAEGLETSAVLQAHYMCGVAALWSGNLRAAEQPLARVSRCTSHSLGRPLPVARSTRVVSFA